MGLLGLVANGVVLLLAGGAAVFGLGAVATAWGNVGAIRAVGSEPEPATEALGGRRVVHGTAEPVDASIDLGTGTPLIAHETTVEKEVRGEWQPVTTVRQAVPFLVDDRIRVQKGALDEEEETEPFSLYGRQLGLDEGETAPADDVDASGLPEEITEALEADRRLRIAWVAAGDEVTVLGNVQYDAFDRTRPGGLLVDAHGKPFELSTGSVAGPRQRVREVVKSVGIGVVAVGLVTVGVNFVFGLGLF